MKYFKICLLSILVFGFTAQNTKQLPEGFVYAKSIIPDIDFDLRYFSTNNFAVSKNDRFQCEVFRLVVGQRYQVEYADDSGQWQDAGQPFVAPATIVSWVDSGPPLTAPHPSKVKMRCYRIREK